MVAPTLTFKRGSLPKFLGVVKLNKTDVYLKALGINSPYKRKAVFEKQVYIGYYLCDETHVLLDLFLTALKSKAQEWKRDLNPHSIDHGENAAVLQQSTAQIFAIGCQIGLLDLPMPESPDEVLAVIQPVHEHEGVRGVKHSLVEEAYSALGNAAPLLAFKDKLTLGDLIRALFSRLLNNPRDAEKIALISMSDSVLNYRNLLSILRQIENQRLADGTVFHIGLEERIRAFYPPFLEHDTLLES